MNLLKYSKLIHENKQNPVFLSELAEQMSADYMACAEQMKDVQLVKPHEWVDIKKSKMKKTDDGWEGKPLSDKMTEMIWRSTKVGKQDVRLQYEMKALEKALASIKSHIYVLNQESRNQF